MAMKRYVDEALEAILDNDLGLSDGDSSDEEEGEDYYAYLGEPVVSPSDIETLTHDVVSGFNVNDDDGNDTRSSGGFLPELDPSDGSSDKEDPLGLTGTCSDHDCASRSDLYEHSDNSDSFPETTRVNDSHSSAESEASDIIDEFESQSNDESSSGRGSTPTGPGFTGMRGRARRASSY